MVNIGIHLSNCNIVLFQTAAINLRPLTVGDECHGTPACEEDEVQQYYADFA